MDLPPLFDDPVLMAVLTLAIAAVLQYQRTLTWTEYRAIHGIKVRLFPRLQRLLPSVLLVSAKNYRADHEYLATDSDSVATVWRRLVGAGASPHLINSVKVRPFENGAEQYSAAHVVWTHEDGTQTEAYLFRAPGTGTDVYAHHETGVVNAEGHLADPQMDGDPRGVVRDALGVTE